MATMQERLDAFRASQGDNLPPEQRDTPLQANIPPAVGEAPPVDPRQANIPPNEEDLFSARMEAYQKDKAAKEAHDSQMAGYKNMDRMQQQAKIDDMSWGEQAAMGAGNSLINVGQGIGNMMGLVDDQTIHNTKRGQRMISDTTAGSIGGFAGETAALAPIGVPGRVAKSVLPLVKNSISKAVTPAMRVLKGKSKPKTKPKKYRTPLQQATLAKRNRAGRAGVEGGLAGAILANPNERETGALWGTGAGFGLDRILSGANRGLVEGMIQKSPSSANLSSQLKGANGRAPFIPGVLAADPAGDAWTGFGKTAGHVLGQIPSTKELLSQQKFDLIGDFYTALLRQQFPKTGEAGVKVFKETGDLKAGIEAAKNAKGTKASQQVYSPTQGSLNQAAENAKGRGYFSPDQLQAIDTAQATATKGAGADTTNRTLQQITKNMGDVLKRPLTESNVFNRDMYHEMEKAGGATTLGFPGLGSLLGSKPVQNLIMGDNILQRRLLELQQTGTAKEARKFMMDIQRAMAAQPASEKGVDVYANPQGLVKEYGNKILDTGKYYTDSALNALRGN